MQGVFFLFVCFSSFLPAIVHTTSVRLLHAIHCTKGTHHRSEKFLIYSTVE
jgi:hypothetical protein